MFVPEPPQAVIGRLTAWAEAEPAIRARCSTARARPGAEVDRFSDYDVLVIVTDLHPCYQDERWLAEAGEVL